MSANLEKTLNKREQSKRMDEWVKWDKYDQCVDP